jgi:hypothetical protein
MLAADAAVPASGCAKPEAAGEPAARTDPPPMPAADHIRDPPGRALPDERLSVEDGRSGFLMVRIGALASARASLSGSHLADALGAAVALTRACHLQGADADEQHAEVTLDELVAGHLRVSRERSVRILNHLQRAGAIERHSARYDGARRLPTRLAFTGAAVPFARVDCRAYDVVAHTAGRALLRHLALYVTLIELAGEQRERHDGSRRVAVATYGELEQRSGISLRAVKDLVDALIACRVLERAAQHSENGMKLANRYRLTDPPAGGAPAEPRTGNTPTMDTQQPDDGPAYAEPTPGTSRTEDGQPPDQGPAGRPSHARAADVARAQSTQTQIPSGVPVTHTPGEEGLVELDDGERLYRRFVASLEATLGVRRTSRMLADPAERTAWRRSAAELLEDFELERLLQAIAYLRGDTILSGRGRTLPQFAAIVDEAILRSSAAASRSGASTASTGVRSDARPWAQVWDELRPKISAFGAGGEERARQALAADPVLVAFVDSIGWRALCRTETPDDIKFAYLAFIRRGDGEEAA